MCKRILKEETNTEGGIPFYKIGTFGNTADVFISEKQYELYKKKYSYPKKGDVLISAAGTIGRTVVFNGEDAYFQDSNIVWINNDETKVLNKYLYYCYKNIRWYTSTGSTILRLYNDNIRNSEIVAPDLSTQKRIADVLSCIDDKIALNNKTNNELENMAKTVYDYWFTQFDFPDANGKPYKASGGKMEYNQVLKREIPAGWEVKRLRTFLDCNKNSITKSHKFDYINYLDTGSLTENVITKYQIITNTDSLPSRAKRIVHKNDILYSSVRPILKHYGIIKYPKENMIASTGFIILSSKKDSKYNGYFYNYIISKSNLNKLVSIAASNVSAYPSINPDDLLDLYIPMPKDYKLLDLFISTIQPMYDLENTNQKENEELSKLRDFLLPLLMNGQIEVK